MENERQLTIKIGITGHRNLTEQQLKALEPVILQAIKNIKSFVEYADNLVNRLEFISPIASGADTLFANVALKYFDGKLIVCLPFDMEVYRKDFDEAGKKEFDRILGLKDRIEVYTNNPFSENNRNDLYLQVGKKVVDTCDFLIAIWNEKKANGLGGTGDVVAYAQSIKKDILIINPTHEKPVINGRLLACLQDCDDDEPKPNALSDHIVKDYFKLYDEIAIRNQVTYKRIWESCFRLGWVAALVLSIKMAFDFSEEVQFKLTLLEILLIVAAIALIVFEKKRSYHKHYLQSRFIAERLRINDLTFQSGYYPIKSETKVIHKALQEMELKYPAKNINKIIRLTCFNYITLDSKKKKVKDFAEGQADYHQNRKERLEKLNHVNSFIKTACVILFAFVVGYHAIIESKVGWLDFLNINENAHTPTPESKPFFLSISFVLYLFIPATVARFEGAKFLNDWERLITQSIYMNSFFTEISNRISSVEDDDELYKLLTEINENMYLENLDWEMFMSNKNENIA